ncbi:hypothetical protein Sjap_011674 [Stephania japonica]|uniref:Uncharacterized protein n=1 Tax=Stephania japonica TaxID=461633 RepID=A0AAP0JBK7_9MAGN
MKMALLYILYLQEMKITPTESNSIRVPSQGVMCVRWNQLCAFSVCFGFQNINCYFITSLGLSTCLLESL